MRDAKGSMIGRLRIDKEHPLYDRSIFKVIVLASVLIIFSMLLVGFLSYYFTEKEVIKKLKNKELSYIVHSISSKIEGRIDRAKETSLLLAEDPSVSAWISGGETDEEQGRDALAKLQQIAKQFDYSNSFIVSAQTGHYWTEAGTILDTMSPDNAEDAWFYKTLASGNKCEAVVDYNAGRNETFVFVNVLIGDVNHPTGVAGVGLGLQDLSKSFEDFKYSPNSHLWLIDESGTIHLSDRYEDRGKNVRDFLAGETLDQVMTQFGEDVQLLEGVDQEGEMLDTISYPIRSMKMRLLFQIPRNDTVYFLNNIKLNTAIAVIIALISIIFFFFYVSRKLADPYKRALQLNRELEHLVNDRTKELEGRNRELLDSIHYAQRIQMSVLPDEEELGRLTHQHFVIWGPRDGVGGDFYWLKRYKDGYFIAVGDCTGHGVPGAFMTMLTISLLEQIAAQGEAQSPADVLNELNKLIKTTLHQTNRDELADDGLDLALCYVTPLEIVFAGAGSTIYIKNDDGIQACKGNKKSLGYRRTPMEYEYDNHGMKLQENTVIYMMTDGIADQNGGDKGFSFGKSRLLQFLEQHGGLPLQWQKEAFIQHMAEYMGDEAQRDDMTLIAFQPKTECILNEKGLVNGD